MRACKEEKLTDTMVLSETHIHTNAYMYIHTYINQDKETYRKEDKS